MRPGDAAVLVDLEMTAVVAPARVDGAGDGGVNLGMGLASGAPST